jgi:hypothetical protein
MALRIKCKCGKSLKVSSKLADKKLLCPGCKKAFRIPAEKFKQAGPVSPAPAAKPQTAVTKKAPPKPKSEVPEAAPVELDLLPDKIDWSSADLSVSQSDILSDLIPDAKPTASSPSGKLGLTCPLCRKVLAPGAVLCIECGFNAATRTYIKTSLPPGATAVKTAPTAGYAADLSRMSRGSRIDHDVVQAPKRSFWADAFSAFGYPFMNVGNGVTLGIVALIYCLELVLGFAGCLGVIGIFIIEGWIAAMYLSVVQDTASGSADMPGIKIQDGPVDDIIKPFFKYIGAFFCAALPASVYFVLMKAGVLPPYLESGVNLLLLTVAGIFFLPVFVVLFAFSATNMLIRIDLIFTTVFRTFLPYLSLWLMLSLVEFVKFYPLVTILVNRSGLNISLPALPEFGLIGNVFFNILDLYLGIIAMRLIGLYYLHFKRRFALVME